MLWQKLKASIAEYVRFKHNPRVFRKPTGGIHTILLMNEQQRQSIFSPKKPDYGFADYVWRLTVIIVSIIGFD